MTSRCKYNTSVLTGIDDTKEYYPKKSRSQIEDGSYYSEKRRSPLEDNSFYSKTRSPIEDGPFHSRKIESPSPTQLPSERHRSYSSASTVSDIGIGRRSSTEDTRNQPSSDNEGKFIFSSSRAPSLSNAPVNHEKFDITSRGLLEEFKESTLTYQETPPIGIHKQRELLRTSIDTLSTDGSMSETLKIRCRNPNCNNTGTLHEAGKNYKTCHNCHTWYCCRECRRSHWSKHRRVCMYTRALALTNHVVFKVRDDVSTLIKFSWQARQGYLANGPGCLKLFFSTPEGAETFINNCSLDKTRPVYIRWQNLLREEMGEDCYRELLEMCQSYNAETKFIFYVSVCILNEMSSDSSKKWERQNVTKCAKIRLSATLASTESQASTFAYPSNSRESDTLITKSFMNKASTRSGALS